MASGRPELHLRLYSWTEVPEEPFRRPVLAVVGPAGAGQAGFRNPRLHRLVLFYPAGTGRRRYLPRDLSCGGGGSALDAGRRVRRGDRGRFTVGHPDSGPPDGARPIDSVGIGYGPDRGPGLSCPQDDRQRPADEVGREHRADFPGGIQERR
ncbi:hypothetical protein AMJ57_04830 [Parcubacteria bacterium SG8_24]|nr:MAG: hypothetical protein AMJ57_04830 [Parcubacteria bacterium SG8_24]